MVVILRELYYIIFIYNFFSFFGKISKNWVGRTMRNIKISGDGVTEHCLFYSKLARLSGNKRSFDVFPVRTSDFQTTTERTCTERGDSWQTRFAARILAFAQDLIATFWFELQGEETSASLKATKKAL